MRLGDADGLAAGIERGVLKALEEARALAGRLTLSCLAIALQDGPAPTSGAENDQHGPSWLTVLVVNPVRLA